MDPKPRHHLRHPWSWVWLTGLSLSLVAGCAEVQNRQWGYPNLLGRRIEARKAASARPPKVILRVDPEPLPGARPIEEP